MKSPQVRRRKALMFGSRTPNRFSMKRISEVWSSTSEQTWPPADHGETTTAGTRKPSPIGSPPTYSPGVPRGRDRRGHVVEQPVVLVVGQDEQGLVPQVLVGRDRVQLLAMYSAPAAGK